MAKREKKVVHNGITHEEMEQAFSDYAFADARIEKITARMDEEMTKIRDKYAPDLKENTEKRTASFEKLQTYAVEKRDELFSRKKSMETAYGTFGFRMGTTSVKQMHGFTTAASLNLALTLAPDFVRTKQELDKKMLIAREEDQKIRELMPKLGVFFDKAETFFVAPKKEGE